MNPLPSTNPLATVLSYPTNTQLAMNKIHFDQLLRGYDLTDVWNWIEENNIGVVNPYHNTQHMMTIALNGFRIYQTELLLTGETQELYGHVKVLVAGMLHDFNHSGGEHADDENIENAIHDGLNKIAGTLDAKFGEGFSDEVEQLIRCTEYPFVRMPHSLAAKALRDADLLQSIEPNGITLILEGLRSEMQVRFGKQISVQEMYEGQVKFLEAAELFTQTGQALWDASKQHMIEACRCYAEYRTGKQQEEQA